MWEKSLSRNLILWELNRSLGCIICPRVGARILVFVCKSVLSPNFIGLVLQLTEWHKYSWNTQIHGLMGILCPQILGSQSYDYYILDAYESWIIIVLSCHRARQAMARRGLVHRARQGMKQQVQNTGLGKAKRQDMTRQVLVIVAHCIMPFPTRRSAHVVSWQACVVQGLSLAS